MTTDAAAPAEKGQLKETERIQAGPGPGRGPFGGPMVGQKASDFKPSAKRLVRRMRPERVKVIAVLGVTVASVLLTAIGPRILGRATDLIFAGLLGGRLPAGTSKDDIVRNLRDSGQDKKADLIASMKDLVPGQGVDFGAVGHVLLMVLAVYLLGSALAWLAGYLLNDVVQAVVKRMRADVEDKVNRLPLSYFDKQPRGELLSRVTNDIDNLSQ
jgi:ATP-binding cassette subfamily B multidrug efflux pump